MIKLALATMALVISSYATAASCKLVTPYAAGGPGALFTSAYAEANPEINLIQYRPGAYASRGIDFMRENPEYGMSAAPLMWVAQNPDKAPAVTMIGLLSLYGQTGVTGKGVTMNDILTKEVVVAIPNIGGSQHLIALELQRVNPKITIVPAPGAAVGVQLVVNKEVDMFITAAVAGLGMVKNYPHVSVVFEIPKEKREITISGVKLMNYGMMALFAHKSASPEQVANLQRCYSNIMSSPRISAALAPTESAPFRASKAEAEAYIQKYLKDMERNGF